MNKCVESCELFICLALVTLSERLLAKAVTLLLGRSLKLECSYSYTNKHWKYVVL
jgi:hypothetical protein